MARSKAPQRRPARAATRASHTPPWLLPLSAALPAFFICPVWAAKWDIVPTLSLEETYTDNVRLAPSGSEEGAFVTLLRPGASIVGIGDRLRLNAFVSADARYSTAGENRVQYQFSGSGSVEAVENLLFIDARAGVTQQNISLLGPQAQSNVNSTDNRTTVQTYSISPYLRHSFGTTAQGEARLRYSSISTDASGTNGTDDSQGLGADLRLTSGPSFKLYTWNVAYSKDTTEYTRRPDVTTERISANGSRLITPQVALTSSVGYETSDYVRAGGEPPKGFFWNSGFEWNPSPRTRLAVNSGKRYFGNTSSLDFRHRTRMTVWSAGYTEDVTSTRAELLVPVTVDTATFLDALLLSRVPDPATRQLAVQDFISQNGVPSSLIVPVNFFTNQIFLVKKWYASVAVNGVRNTLFANVFRQDRTAEDTSVSSTGDFAASTNIVQTGGSLLWTWRISPHTSSNMSVSYSLNEFADTGREDTVKSIRFSVTRQFQPRLSGTVTVRRLQNDSNQNGAEYTENAVSAALTMRF